MRHLFIGVTRFLGQDHRCDALAVVYGLVNCCVRVTVCVHGVFAVVITVLCITRECFSGVGLFSALYRVPLIVLYLLGSTHWVRLPGYGRYKGYAERSETLLNTQL